jgi:hypothetical protein
VLLSDNRKEFQERTKTGILDNREKCLSLQLFCFPPSPKRLAAADVRSFAVTTVLSLTPVGSSGGVVASISRLARVDLSVCRPALPTTSTTAASLALARRAILPLLFLITSPSSCAVEKSFA